MSLFCGLYCNIIKTYRRRRRRTHEKWCWRHTVFIFHSFRVCYAAAALPPARWKKTPSARTHHKKKISRRRYQLPCGDEAGEWCAWNFLFTQIIINYIVKQTTTTCAPVSVFHSVYFKFYLPKPPQPRRAHQIKANTHTACRK